MPVQVVYGDSFLVAGALKELKAQIGPSEVWEANFHQIAAADASLSSLMPVCDAIPFLAEKRLVLVEGALSALERRDGRTGSRGRGAPTQAASTWEGLEDYVSRMPPTTSLVFADGAVRRGNPFLERLRPVAQVIELPTPNGEALARWVRTATTAKGGSINPGAIALLCRLVGPNLFALDGELEKLILYADGSSIEESHVRQLVSQAREASIFTVVDAILEGRSKIALNSAARLFEGGADFSYIVAMLARQLRLVLLARDFAEQGHSWPEVGRRLNIGAEFALRKTLDQAKRHSRPGLVRLYERLLEADLAVKQGKLEEEVALELLVAGSTPTR